VKVVVTGLGALCALGENVEKLWAAVERGDSGIAPIRRFDIAPFETKLGAMAPLGDEYEDEERRLLAYGRKAAAEALRRAAIVDRSQVALVLGTCNGSLGKDIHIGSIDLARVLKLGGPAITLSTACASSTHAIAFAADLVRRGEVRFVLAGGVDILRQDVFAGFHSLGLLAKTPCAPFSIHLGTTLGEGAAFMLLETEQSAQTRGVKPLAEFLGYGLSADAFHDTKPEPSGMGMARALAAALQDACLAPKAIDYFNAHGTGTAANDAAEWRAIQRVFGDHAERLPVSSSKSFLGHAQGAAGALEAVVTLMAMAHQVVPPTLHFTEPRPNSPVDPVAAPKPRPHVVRNAVCANAAFGGANAALVFARDTLKTRPHVIPRISVEKRSADILSAGRMPALPHVTETLRPRRTEPRALGISGVGAVQDWSRLNQSVPLTELRGLDASARLLASAVTAALLDAKLRLRSKDCEEIGLFVGQTRVSPESYLAFGKSIHERGLAHLSASAFTRMVVNNATGVCCRLFGLKGPSATLATGADSGLVAFVLGANHLAWRDDVSRLLAAAVDEPGPSDSYDNAAACLLLNAQDDAAPVRLVAWALAANRETAVVQALSRANLDREEVTSMAVSGPPASAALRAVIAAAAAIKRGERGPFLISDRGEGSASAALILEARSRR